MNLRTMIDGIFAEGTSEGAYKAWESRDHGKGGETTLQPDGGDDGHQTKVPNEVKLKMTEAQFKADDALWKANKQSYNNFQEPSQGTWTFLKYSNSDKAPIYKHSSGHTVKVFPDGKWTMRDSGFNEVATGVTYGSLIPKVLDGPLPQKLETLTIAPPTNKYIDLSPSPSSAPPTSPAKGSKLTNEEIGSLKKFAEELNTGGSGWETTSVISKLKQQINDWKGGSPGKIRGLTLAYVNGLSDNLPKSVVPLMTAIQYAPKLPYELFRVMTFNNQDDVEKAKNNWRSWAKQGETALAPQGFGKSWTSYSDPKYSQGKAVLLHLDEGSNALNITNLDSHKGETEHIPAGVFKITSVNENEDIGNNLGTHFVVHLKQLSTFAVNKESATTHKVSEPKDVGVFKPKKKVLNKGSVKSGKYIEGTPLHTVFSKLLTENSYTKENGDQVYDPVMKSDIFNALGGGKHSHSLLSFVKIHGSKNGKWFVDTKGAHAQLTMKSQGGN